MSHRNRYRFDLLAGVLLVLIAMGDAQAGEVLSVESAVVESLSANPGLESIQARAMALAEIPDQAEALPDPRLSFNIVNLPLDSLSLSQEPMTQVQVGIAQALPYPGKLALRSQAASYEAEAAEADVDEKRLQLARDVRTVWWNLFYLDRALEVVSQNQNLLQQIINVAETRYQVGQGQQQDILLAELESSKLADKAIRLNNLRENEMMRLNVLLNRPVETSITLPESVVDALPNLLSVQALQDKAIVTRPLLAAQQGRTHAARSRADLAKKGYAPDFQLGAIYGFRNGDNADGSSRSDMASIIFSMNLPIYSGSKQDRSVDQRNAEWVQQKFQLQDRRTLVALEVQQALSDYQRSGERASLFQQQIIPQANQTVDTTLAGYQVGKADFLILLRI